MQSKAFIFFYGFCFCYCDVLTCIIRVSRLLAFSCLDQVTSENGTNGSRGSLKRTPEEERRLLVEIKPLVQKFVHESPDLQLQVLYTTQLFCHDLGFPKGNFHH